jgi:hypothetical protein
MATPRPGGPAAGWTLPRLWYLGNQVLPVSWILHGEIRESGALHVDNSRARLLFLEIVPISATRCWTLWIGQRTAGTWHPADRHYVLRFDPMAGSAISSEGCFAKKQDSGRFRVAINGLSAVYVKNNPTIGGARKR